MKENLNNMSENQQNDDDSLDSFEQGMRDHFLKKFKEMGIEPDSEEAKKIILGEKGLERLKEIESTPVEQKQWWRDFNQQMSRDFDEVLREKEKNKRKKGVVVLTILSAVASIIIVFTIGLNYFSDTDTQEKTIAQDSTDQHGSKVDSTKLAVVESYTSTSTTSTAKEEKVVIDEPEPTKDIAVIEKEPKDIDNELIAFYPTNEINFRSPDGKDKAEMLWKYTVEEVLKLNKNSPYEISFSISEDGNTLMNKEVFIKKENRFFTYVWEISILSKGVQVKKIVKEHEINKSRDYNDESYEIDVDIDLKKIFDK